jgi:signal transduction histidine kinase
MSERARSIEGQRQDLESMERELERLRGELFHSVRLTAIGEISAQIAHDLRNPLGVIRNAAYLLRRRLGDAGWREAEILDLIEREVAHCDGIIRNLLEVARPKEPVKRELVLDDLVHEAFARLHAPEGVTLRYRAEEAPFRIHVDPVHWGQVLDNLLANALEAVGDAGEIEVVAARRPGRDDVVVRDSGPGVPPELRQRIFELLFTTRAKGTGLGLAICRQIVEAHGGTIAVDDVAAGDVGESGSAATGATFRIELPQE